MGEIVLKDGSFRLGTSDGSTSLTDHVRSITVNYAAELLDKTAMGDASRRRIAGLKDWSMTVEFNQDFADNHIDEILYGKIGASDSSNCWIQTKPTTAKGSATNPRYYGYSYLESYSPMGQGVGELGTVSVTFQGDGDLTRAVTSGGESGI